MFADEDLESVVTKVERAEGVVDGLKQKRINLEYQIQMCKSGLEKVEKDLERKGPKAVEMRELLDELDGLYDRAKKWDGFDKVDPEDERFSEWVADTGPWNKTVKRIRSMYQGRG